MSTGPRDPTFESLPGTVPIFPLPGVLLLPRARLPLNIFEPRYLAMTQDALATPARLIGMIQPVDPAELSAQPAVYRTGCAGRITAFEETEDGRYHITLTGLCRFEVGEELPGRRGYRVVAPDWRRFSGDLLADGDAGLDRPRLIRGLRAYFKKEGISANWSALEATPDERLVNALSMICPFDPREKQALLEAPTLRERAGLLVAMVEMAVIGGPEGDTLVTQ